MSAKGKARPRRQPGTGQQMEAIAACGAANFSGSNCTTAAIGRQERLKISDILPGERENALKMSELKQLLSEDSRTIRLMIQRERQHLPIISDNFSGYWVSDDEAEVRQFTNSMRHRARQIWATARNVERSAGLTKHEQLDGQVDILEGGIAGGKTGDHDLL